MTHKAINLDSKGPIPEQHTVLLHAIVTDLLRRCGLGLLAGPGKADAAGADTQQTAPLQPRGKQTNLRD